MSKLSDPAWIEEQHEEFRKRGQYQTVTETNEKGWKKRRKITFQEFIKQQLEKEGSGGHDSRD